MPALAFTGWFVALVARRLGATPPWAAFGGLALACSPIALATADMFKTDTFYVALEMAALLAGLSWLRGGSGRWWCVLLTILAALQRQHGAALAPAITAGLVLAWRGRPPSRADAAALAGLWLGAAAAVVVPVAAGVTGEAFRQVLLHAAAAGPTAPATGVSRGPGKTEETLLSAAPMIGLFLLPLAPALAASGGRRLSGWHLPPLVLALLGLAGLALAPARGGMVLPGGLLGPWGLGFLAIGGAKPQLWPAPLYLALEAATVAAALIALGWRRDIWTPASLGPGGLMVVAFALSQMAAMRVTGPLDRYYIPVMAPLVALVAAAVSRSGAAGQRLRGAAGLALVAAGVVLYAVGQQDYEAWQSARDAAARLAYRSAPPSAVEAGQEAYGPYYLVPEYGRSGRLPAGTDLAYPHAAQASISLRFAAPGSTEKRVDYWSLAPGAVVIRQSD